MIKSNVAGVHRRRSLSSRILDFFRGLPGSQNPRNDLGIADVYNVDRYILSSRLEFNSINDKERPVEKNDTNFLSLKAAILCEVTRGILCYILILGNSWQKS